MDRCCLKGLLRQKRRARVDSTPWSTQISPKWREPHKSPKVVDFVQPAPFAEAISKALSVVDLVLELRLPACHVGPFKLTISAPACVTLLAPSDCRFGPPRLPPITNLGAAGYNCKALGPPRASHASPSDWRATIVRPSGPRVRHTPRPRIVDLGRPDCRFGPPPLLIS